MYSEFEGGEVPTRENVRKILYWYVNDYCQEMVEERIRQAVDPALDFAVKIIKDADLTDLRYLYQFGEYVTEEEEKTAALFKYIAGRRNYCDGAHLYGRLSDRLYRYRQRSVQKENREYSVCAGI